MQVDKQEVTKVCKEWQKNLPRVSRHLKRKDSLMPIRNRLRLRSETRHSDNQSSLIYRR